MALNYISIGEKIKAIRKRKGFSQLALSELIDRSPTYISYIEGGIKSMSLDTFILLVNALNTTADELLMDNLKNTIKVSNHEFAELLSDCSDYEKRIMFDVVTATKKSIRENRYYIRTRW
ncbi:MAG: XRE family transcriptional regulator [Firmicutes bacterium HGW-Firmicutes-21]|nr:MAG: XRE family transcriptional regulator [Firmicutes bacterium HGW-Firmicutes-21]